MRGVFRWSISAVGKVVEKIRPHAVRYAAERYGGEQSDELTVCPTEDFCGKFAGAAGENREQKELNACVAARCEAYPTKLNPMEPVFLTNLLNRSLKRRRARDSGFGINENTVSAIEFETVLMIDELCDQHEIYERQKQSELILGMLGNR